MPAPHADGDCGDDEEEDDEDDENDNDDDDKMTLSPPRADVQHF